MDSSDDDQPDIPLTEYAHKLYSGAPASLTEYIAYQLMFQFSMKQQREAYTMNMFMKPLIDSMNELYYQGIQLVIGKCFYCLFISL